MRKSPGTQHLSRARHKDVVTVDERPCFIETETAIRVAVVGDADVRACFEHRTAQGVQMCRAAVVVDVDTVRERMNDLKLRAERAQHLRHCLICRAVRAVEYDFHAVEPLRAGADDIVHILIDEIVPALYRTDMPPCRTRCVVARFDPPDERLEFVLHCIRELIAVAAKELDAVVAERIVRRRDHNARLRPVFVRKVGDGRRRNNARKDRNTARRADARRERRLEHLARDARIPTDQDARTRLFMRAEVKRRRAPEPICQLR